MKQETPSKQGAAPPSKHAKCHEVAGLGKWVERWFLATFFICTIDATFILLRPHTLPGGKLAVLPWSLWHIYIKSDKRYASMSDGFVVLQSWLNLIEITVGLICVWYNRQQQYSTAHKIAVVVSVCTWYKTVVYLGLDPFDDYPFVKHLYARDYWVNVVFPSSFWVIIPILVMLKSLSKLH